MTQRKVVSRKTFKKNFLANFESDSSSKSIRTSGGRAPASEACCKEEACLPRSHYEEKPRVQNCESRGRCGLQKPKKIFSANNVQGSMKRGEKFSEKHLKKRIRKSEKPTPPTPIYSIAFYHV